ncbi:MAG: hypothetical protein GXO65_03060 [Euryarchaeota archaeon]|nr:hypothetical protein [Euryarchaeota archaeon]
MKLAGFVGASTVMGNYRTEVVEALTQAFTSSQAIILDGQACEGCAISLLQGADPDLYTAVSLGVSLDFLIPISPETGRTAAEKIENFIEGEKRPKVLAVEGSVPMAEDGKYQTYWDYRHEKRRPFKDLLKEAAEAADVIIAIGTTAAYGGIPRGHAPKYNYESKSSYGLEENRNPTGAVGVGDALAMMGVDLSGKPVPAVVNLPSCPVHPDHFFLTVVDVLFGHIPELDSLGRPKAFYGRLIHDQCQFRGFFDRGEFLTSFNQYSGNINDPYPTSPDEKGAGCFLLLGCKGPVTYNDCPSRGWNCRAESVSWPNLSGGPCTGCAYPGFPDGKSEAFYVPLTEEITRLPKPPEGPIPPEIIKERAEELTVGIAAGTAIAGGIYTYSAKKENEEE